MDAWSLVSCFSFMQSFIVITSMMTTIITAAVSAIIATSY